MKFTFRKDERLPTSVQINEIDERHNLAQHVFFRREKLGWTQDELARKIGTTQPQIANVEAGVVNPTLRTLVRLAHAFDCHVRDLLCPTQGDPEMDALRDSISRVRTFFEREQSRVFSYTSGKGSFCPQPERSLETAVVVNEMFDRFGAVGAQNARRYTPQDSLALIA